METSNHVGKVYNCYIIQSLLFPSSYRKFLCPCNVYRRHNMAPVDITRTQTFILSLLADTSEIFYIFTIYVFRKTFSKYTEVNASLTG